MNAPATTSVTDIATRLYEAFASADGAAMAGLLHPDFTGRVSAGMPLGVGGEVSSPEQMLRDVWHAVFTRYDVAPQPDEYVVVGDGRVIVLGYYRGHDRAGGASFEAAFAHDITVRDGRIASLVQITDTRQWYGALPTDSDGGLIG